MPIALDNRHECNGYVDISSFLRGSQCILGSLGGKQSFFHSRMLRIFIYFKFPSEVFVQIPLIFTRMFSVPAGRREVNARGDGNCFYRAMALAVDGKTDHAYPVFRAMCNKMRAEYPKVCEAY